MILANLHKESSRQFFTSRPVHVPVTNNGTKKIRLQNTGFFHSRYSIVKQFSVKIAHMVPVVIIRSLAATDRPALRRMALNREAIS